MIELYDILIPALPKDFHKLKYLLRSIHANLTGWEVIHFVTPRKNIEELLIHCDELPVRRYIRHADEDMVDFDPTRCSHRPNWVRQQYIKLFQTVTSDLYLTIDADAVFLKPLPMYAEDGRRILWMGWEQNHRPYFAFQERMLGLPREYPHTFVNDMNFIDRRIVREMLSGAGYDSAQAFIEASYDVIEREKCYPGEPEIWGQYVMKHHPDRYLPLQCKTLAITPKETSHMPEGTSLWSDDEIEAAIRQYGATDLQMIMFHDWWTKH